MKKRAEYTLSKWRNFYGIMMDKSCFKNTEEKSEFYNAEIDMIIKYIQEIIKIVKGDI